MHPIAQLWRRSTVIPAVEIGSPITILIGRGRRKNRPWA